MALFNLKLKIQDKLFLAILVANCLLVGTIYIFGSLIFDTSFRDYLDRTEATRLTPLVVDLANEYSKQGDWQWAGNRRNLTWQRLVNPYMTQGQVVRMPPTGRGLGKNEFDQNRRRIDKNEGRPQPGRRPPKARPFLLLDQNQQPVIGPLHEFAKAFWIPIEHNDMLVGQLGFVRQLNITSELDRLFLDRIRSNFLWMILGILVISAIISIPLSQLLVRPIDKLKQALHALALGNFKVFLVHRSNDEFSELVQDLNALSDTLDKNLKLRQQWIADISHELRTPVAVLQGELEAIQDGIRQFDKLAVDSLHQEILRLSRLVNDLHELSLSDLGALTYQKAPINVVDLVENVVAQHRDSLNSQSIDVSVQFPNDNQSNQHLILGDSRRLEQLLTNLANNTRHYTQPPGKLQVSIQKQSDPKSQMDRVVIIWSDSSPGASDTDLTQLFERLFRVETSRNRNSGGSGLGLAICQNIVAAHQGSIEAKHSPLGGISIVMTFPLLNH
jgi:two-component system sensor histidine kinase BaeS